MEDIHIFAEWLAHYAKRPYSVIPHSWRNSAGRPLPPILNHIHIKTKDQK